MTRFQSLFFLLAVSVASAADPIRVPSAPVVPTPLPSAGESIPLAGDQFFVIDSDVEVIVKAVPAGLVRVVPELGPLAVKGRFVDSPGVVRRDFKGKFIYTVEPVGKGTCTLLVIPKGGVGGEAEILTRTLEVDAAAEVGRKPCPPCPTPIPVPVPVPVPTPVDPFSVAVKAAYDAETGLDRKTHVLALASLYRTAGTTTALDPSVKTYGDLFNDMKIASATLLPTTSIPGVRKAVGARLNAEFSKPTDPINRTKVQSEFAAVALALEGATK